LTCNFPYEGLRDKILKEILNIKDPESGQTLQERNLLDYLHVNEESITVVYHPANKFSPVPTCVYIGRKIKELIRKICNEKKIKITIIDPNYED